MKNNMENKLNVSVILPLVSGLVKDFDDLLSKSIESLKKQHTQVDELVIVHSQEDSLKIKLKNFDFGDLNVTMIENDGPTDYQSQINLGVEKCKNDWISFFEVDDEYSFIWFKNVKRFIDSHPESDGFLPIVVDVDEKEMFAGYTNEATFAASFNTEIGILTNDLLNSYQNFQTSGMVLRKSSFLENGGFKTSMKLTFAYEFLLRLTYNSVRIMTIPRLGYKHMNMRESSIFWNYKNGSNVLTEDEVKFWVDAAKKEYFFTSDRNIKFESTNG